MSQMIWVALPAVAKWEVSKLSPQKSNYNVEKKQRQNRFVTLTTT